MKDIECTQLESTTYIYVPSFEVMLVARPV
jgi:hypothetical protein